MGLVRCLLELSFRDNDSALERSRKVLVVPLFCILGAVVLTWNLLALRKFFIIADRSGNECASAILDKASGLGTGLSLLSAGVYVISTGRMPGEVIEVSALVVCVCLLMWDASLALVSMRGVSLLNVLVLDGLLVGQCRGSAAKAVVILSAIWMMARATMDAENVSGTCAGDDCFTRFSMGYFVNILFYGGVTAAALVIDFHFTRGFATSMTEQKALVEASVGVSEAAAVLLSRYETDATLDLLKGPDGSQLPPLLRSALLQLVGNLALYRPYLPQSCLPGSGQHDGDERRTATSCSGSTDDSRKDFGGVVPVDVQSDDTASRSSRRSSRTRSSCTPSRQDLSFQIGVRRMATAEPSLRNASVLAANSQSSLRKYCSRKEAAGFVRGEVECFTGAVAAENGLVDLVSGDHMFANFNASRLCTTHRSSAARTAWGLCSCESARTAAACSGRMVCGDFGTSEMRRFMILGAAFNTMLALERVAARLGTVLVDEAVGADADVVSSFFRVLVERLCFVKAGPKPFLVWRFAGRRCSDSGPDEWMYELERQEPNPHEPWNQLLHDWLHFGAPVDEEHVEKLPGAAALITEPREQSYLREAEVVGGTVSLCATTRDSD